MTLHSFWPMSTTETPRAFCLYTFSVKLVLLHLRHSLNTCFFTPSRTLLRDWSDGPLPWQFTPQSLTGTWSVYPCLVKSIFSDISRDLPGWLHTLRDRKIWKNLTQSSRKDRDTRVLRPFPGSQTPYHSKLLPPRPPFRRSHQTLRYQFLQNLRFYSSNLKWDISHKLMQTKYSFMETVVVLSV